MPHDRRVRHRLQRQARTRPIPSAPARTRSCRPGLPRHPTTRCARRGPVAIDVGLLHELPTGRRPEAGADDHPQTLPVTGRRRDTSCDSTRPASAQGFANRRGRRRRASPRSARAATRRTAPLIVNVGARRDCPCSSANPSSVQPIVPLRSAATRFGMPALTSDCVPMMLRVRPAQLTMTRVCGSGASAPDALAPVPHPER